jgi:hypothetical protein
LYLLVLAANQLGPGSDPSTPLAAVTFLVSILVLHLACQAADRYLSRWLFREEVSGVQL